VGTIVQLAELQRAYRARRRSRHRAELRKPSAAAYQIVSRRLYAEGAIDNLGLADAWIGSAGEAERATLFSDIATALLGAS
jgi:hypothetical protein